MKNYADNKGITIPIVLIVLLITIIFGFTIMFIITTQTNINNIDKASKKALEYAEAGYNRYLWHLNDDVEFYNTLESEKLQNTDISFEDGFYRLEITIPDDDDRFVTIKSTGWTADNPNIKRTISVKIRKKQFVHHVYVSDSEYIKVNDWFGNEYKDYIYWTTGDESHGPYHSNDVIAIDGNPVFYDEVTYVEKFYLKRGRPKYKLKEAKYESGENIEIPKQVDMLKFPESNTELMKWAEKDNMIFTGRTCIYLDGDYIKIRNKNETVGQIKRIKISDIKNNVIYIEGESKSDENTKFDLDSGNVFISGTLKGQLTIAASNNIYITHSDPTNWYEDRENNMQTPPIENVLEGGITYQSTTFSPSEELSVFDEEKGIYTRYANGSDMLGLIAQNDVLILHYGWPKYKNNDYDKGYWDYKWVLRRRNRWSKEYYAYDVAPNNVTIHAAIFAVTGGFGYEDYKDSNWRNYTKKGNITLWGNITQKSRKAVGLIGTTGYNKLYAHDPRMFYDYPPHILEPTNVGWEIHDWKEIKE